MEKFIIMLMIISLAWTHTTDTIWRTNDVDQLCTDIYNTELSIAKRVESFKKIEPSAAARFEADVLNVATRIHHDLMTEIAKRNARK